MGFGDILGQMMQNGLGGQGRTASRVDRGTQGAGGAMEGLLAQLQGALGGVGGQAKDFVGNKQVGGLTGGQIGGIGAIAGALLGGGAGGAVKGGAMAVLGTLALNALKNAQAQSSAPAELQATPQEVAALANPDAERLMVVAMISAAKADGNIDQEEMQKIIGKAGADSMTAEEKQFILSQVQAPLDIPALAAQVTSPAQAAAVYAASLFAITVDTDQERAYLEELAKALRLDDGTVTLLRQTSGLG